MWRGWSLSILAQLNKIGIEQVLHESPSILLFTTILRFSTRRLARFENPAPLMSIVVKERLAIVCVKILGDMMAVIIERLITR